MSKTLTELSNKTEFLAAGLMSGTSMDGVDAAVVRMSADALNPAVEVVSFLTAPFPEELRTSLADVAFGQQCTAEDIAVLHTSVSVAFSTAFAAACQQAKIAPESVDFIGSHGQTVAHAPPSGDGMTLIAGTLQLGPPAMIAGLTGVVTVGDFRTKDIALGGQGAPLAPYADFVLRRSSSEDRLILNIGGIANVTYLPRGCAESEVLAFDTGPGNMVLDAVYRALFPNEEGFENMAAHLGEGEPSLQIVDEMLSLDYFSQKPPKSAGHREFGGKYAWHLLSQAEAAGLSRQDTLATAMTLTSRSIQHALREFVQPAGNVDKIYVTGGGAKNVAMMAELKFMLAPAEVASIDVLGIEADAKEAVDFALLARETILGRHNVLPVATGAARGAVLGTIATGD